MKRKNLGRKKTESLTEKDLDDLGNKLEAKCPMCWNYVSETLEKQYYSRNS